LKVKEEVVARTKMNLAHYKQELKDGFLYIRDKKYLRYFVILAVYLNGILVPMNSLQSPLVSEVLHSNEVMLSVMSGLLTIGMLVGSVSFPYLRAKLSERALIQSGGYSIGVYYLLLILIGQFIHLDLVVYLLVGAVSFLLGLCVSLLTSFINVEFMKSVEANFMARVSALFGAVCVASMPIVSFIISLIAKFVDTSIIFIISGACGILVCLFYCNGRRINRLMHNQTESIEVKPEIINEVQPEMMNQAQSEIVSEEQPSMLSEVELG
jgi:MFS family permease